MGLLSVSIYDLFSYSRIWTSSERQPYLPCLVLIPKVPNARLSADYIYRQWLCETKIDSPWSLGTLDLNNSFTSVTRLKAPLGVFLNY